MQNEERTESFTSFSPVTDAIFLGQPPLESASWVTCSCGKRNFALCERNFPEIWPFPNPLS
jgi:hypothetical protein